MQTTAIKTKNLNIRTSEDEYRAICEFAKFQGKSMSGFVLDLIHEYIEDWEDIRDYKEAMSRSEPKYNMEDVRKELGI